MFTVRHFPNVSPLDFKVDLERAGSSLHYWSHGDKLVLYGGFDDMKGFRQEVLVYDISKGIWSEKVDRKLRPLGRRGHCSVIFKVCRSQHF